MNLNLLNNLKSEINEQQEPSFNEMTTIVANETVTPVSYENISQLNYYLSLALLTEEEYNSQCLTCYTEIKSKYINDLTIVTDLFENFFDKKFFIFDEIQVLELVRNVLFLVDNNCTVCINELVNLFNDVSDTPILQVFKLCLLLDNYELIKFNTEQESISFVHFDELISVLKNMN